MELTDEFKQNYERWLDIEVFSNQIDWDQVITHWCFDQYLVLRENVGASVMADPKEFLGLQSNFYVGKFGNTLQNEGKNR